MVFANSEGELAILDAYCRHMGGDLSQGTIKGDEVACPFHDWRWAANGRCTEDPLRPPGTPGGEDAVVEDRSTRTACCSSGTIPRAIPRRPTSPSPASRARSATSGRDWVWYPIDVDTNCREIVDNIVDMAHFFYVHYSFPTFFKNVFEGHVASQFMRGQAPLRTCVRTQPVSPKMLGSRSDATYFGPSFMVDDLVYQYEDYDVESVLINCHYPVSADKFVLQYGMIVKKSDRFEGDAADEMAKNFGASSPRASSRTSRSGRTRPASRIRCCAKRTARSTSSAAGTSSSTSTSRT